LGLRYYGKVSSLKLKRKAFVIKYTEQKFWSIKMKTPNGWILGRPGTQSSEQMSADIQKTAGYE
jgi:hypothetical protein